MGQGVSSFDCGCIRGAVGFGSSGIQGSANLLATDIKGVAGMGTYGIRGSVGIICTPNTGVYLRIDPKVLWFFSEGETHSVDVVSNTRWIVKL